MVTVVVAAVGGGLHDRRDLRTGCTARWWRIQ